MKRALLISTVLILVISPAICQAMFPMRLAGFKLGDSIETCQNLIQPESASASGYYDYIAEMEIMPMEGLKSGSILLGQCDAINKILGIKLKFEESSRPFFKKLLKNYENKFGPPDEYKGDVFQSIIAWKWSFKNDSGERISLTIQHNKQDQEGKIGNTVKLSLVSQIENEMECHRKIQAQKPKPVPIKVERGKEFWDMYTPK